jgi:hypothetical protein
LILRKDEGLAHHSHSHPLWILTGLERFREGNQLSVTSLRCMGDVVVISAFARANGESVERTVQSDNDPLPRRVIGGSFTNKPASTLKTIESVGCFGEGQVSFLNKYVQRPNENSVQFLDISREIPKIGSNPA